MSDFLERLADETASEARRNVAFGCLIVLLAAIIAISILAIAVRVWI